MTVNGLCYGQHNFRGMQHSDFHGMRTNVLDHRINLVSKHLRRNAVNTPYAQRVLGCQGGDGGHAIAAQGTDGFQVGLYACTPTAV